MAGRNRAVDSDVERLHRAMLALARACTALNATQQVEMIESAAYVVSSVFCAARAVRSGRFEDEELERIIDGFDPKRPSGMRVDGNLVVFPHGGH